MFLDVSRGTIHLFRNIHIVREKTSHADPDVPLISFAVGLGVETDDSICHMFTNHHT